MIASGHPARKGYWYDERYYPSSTERERASASLALLAPSDALGVVGRAVERANRAKVRVLALRERVRAYPSAEHAPDELRATLARAERNLLRATRESIIARDALASLRSGEEAA